MEKFIYDESNGLWYELQSDYYFPCLKLPEQETKEIGVWGLRHLDYLKQHRRGTLTRLRMECRLNAYLYEINAQAEEMFDTLIKQLKESEKLTEQLKRDNQLVWVAKMNNIRQRANEIIYKELIYI